MGAGVSSRAAALQHVARLPRVLPGATLARQTVPLLVVRGCDPARAQREITMFEVLVRLMLFGTNGKGAIGAKAFVTVTATVLPG